MRPGAQRVGIIVIRHHSHAAVLCRKFIPHVPEFTYLRANYYVNRERRSAVEGSTSFSEDVALCMCEGDGCGEGCMNRMVMYECLPGHCTEPNCRNQVRCALLLRRFA